MKTTMKLFTAAVVIGWPPATLAQTREEHQRHLPGPAVQAQATPPQTPAPAQPQAQPQSPSQSTPQGFMGQMMQSMPEQCRAAMQNMPQNCMNMMEQTMQDRMRQGGMMGGEMMGGGTMGGMMRGGMMRGGMMGRGMMGGGMMGGGMQPPATVSDASKAYMEAAEKMYDPIMEGLQADDPDIAFVRAMIAQSQGAIELAKVRLQYGKNEQTRKWADDAIQRQQAEIDEMQAWLKKQVK